MKCLWLLLSLIAACACEGEVADTAASSNSVPVSADSVPDAANSIPVSADSVLVSDNIPSPTELLSSASDGSYGIYGINYGGLGGYRDGGYRDGINRDGANRDSNYRDGARNGNYADGGIRDGGNDFRNGGIYEGVYRDGIYEGRDYRMFFIPRLVGRQGLGFQKRNFFSLGMRFPITPKILEPIGYRPLIKELYFEPLSKYNNNNGS